MDYILTCHTDGCENNGIAIPLFTDADSFMCGACGEIITDAVEA